MMVETQKYIILKKIGTVEIRNYGECIMATTKLAVNDRSQAFRRIANYIFRGNKKGEKISMTSPVIMKDSGKFFEMSFVMPSKYSLKDLPKPSRKEVVLKKIKKRKIAVLSFSGFMSDDKILIKTKELLGVLKSAKLKTKGEPFFMGYNPPWTLPFLRRNEVAVEVYF